MVIALAPALASKPVAAPLAQELQSHRPTTNNVTLAPRGERLTLLGWQSSTMSHFESPFLQYNLEI